MTTTAPVFMLKGQALLDHVAEYMPLIERGELTRTQMVLDAGYVLPKGTAAYVDFYTELLRAKGVTPVTDADVYDKAYESLDSDTQALYDAVDAKVGEKWDHEDVMSFIEHLDDIGITTAEQFDDSFEGEYDNITEFVEYWVTDVVNAQIPDFLYNHIYWYEVWDCELRYDFNTIEFDYSVYVFHNN